MTLNQIAQAFCDAVNKPFDVQYIERIKFTIKYWRATLIRQDFERNGISKDMLQSFIMPLTKVDAVDSCVVNIGCNILRTTNKVPKPVRIKGSSLFQYVGSVNILNQAFIEVGVAELNYAKYKKYTKVIPRYIYINNYLYIYTTGHHKFITISSVFVEPELAMNLCADGCPNYDDEFPIGEDMIAAIFKGMASGELQVRTQDVEISEDAKK